MTTHVVVAGSVATGGACSGSREGEGREVERGRKRGRGGEREMRREGDKERE